MHNEDASEKEEIKILKNLLRTTDNKHVHIKYQVIILHLRDYTSVHIAKIMNLNPHTVGIYINHIKKTVLKIYIWVNQQDILGFL